MDAILRSLYEKRTKLFEDMKALMAKADAEKREMNADEDGQWNKMDQEIDKLTADIEKREKLASVSTLLSSPRPALVPAPQPSPAADIRGLGSDANESAEQRTARIAEEMDVFRSWVRFGTEVLTPEQQKMLKRLRTFVKPGDLPPELRAQGSTTTAGGYLIPQGFSGELEKALKAFGGVRSVARAFPTPEGNDIPWPTVDDTANVGELLAENSQAASQDVTFGQIVLKAYKYSSKVVLVPLELLQDSFFNVDDLLRDLLTERIGRITNTHFTTGTGTGQPKGVVTESGSGKVGLSGQTTTVIYDDIVDLEHSVNAAYRSGASFMFADSTLKALKKVKDTTGRPIWAPGFPGFSNAAPSTIMGYPYTINEDMAVMAANAKSILFGNFSKYVVRDVMAITLLRLVERYAEFGQVGFIAFSRHDARAIQPAALKYYANSAT